MDRVCLSMTVVLCVTLSLAITVPPGLELRCPSRYRVKALDNKVVEFEVLDNKTECDRLARKKHVKEMNNAMRPSIKIVHKDGQYRANISWNFNLRGNKLPRDFMINFTFYDINKRNSEESKYLSNTCVRLRVVGDRKIKGNRIPATAGFYFDCLPLLNEPNIGLDVQLLGYTKRKGRRCRSLRSLPDEKGPCGPNVQCSTRYSFPISKNAHPFRQCRCYMETHGYPKLNWFYDYTEKKFQINFTNVPPYLDHATIDVVDAMNENMFIEINVSDIHNGEINIMSEEFLPGEYTVYVCVKLKLYMECTDPEKTENLYKTEIEDLCPFDDYLTYSDQKLNVSWKVDDTEPPSNLQTILGIVGAVVFVAIVTTVTFVVCRCCRRKPNTNCCQQSEQSANGTDQNNGEMRELNPEVRSLLGEGQHTVPQTDTETEFIQTSRPEIDIMSGPNQPEAETVSMSRDDQVMLLYHPDVNNAEHNNRVKVFSQTLTRKYQISLQSATARNWQDFAESAFVTFQNVVLIISKDLFTICHQYINSEHPQQNPVAELNHDIIPCIALEQMHKLMQQDPKRKDVALHIVTLDRQVSETVLHKFLKDHSFLTKENSYIYDFWDKDIHSTDLTVLLNRFKPTAEKPIPLGLQQMMIDMNFS